MVLAGRGGRFAAGCDGLGCIVDLGAGDEEGDIVLADDCDGNPRMNESLDLEGPSFAATTPRLSKNFLYSYLAGRTPSEHRRLGGAWKVILTSNILLEVTIPFLFDHVRRRRVPDLIGIIDGIRLDVSHLFHGLTKWS